MNISTSKRRIWLPLGAAMGLAVATFIAYPNVATAWDVKVTLTGDQEVPSVKTAGTGTGTITVGNDKSVTGSVTTRGIKGTAAHIHEAPAGKNGPVIIPLDKDGDKRLVLRSSPNDGRPWEQALRRRGRAREDAREDHREPAALGRGRARRRGLRPDGVTT